MRSGVFGSFMNSWLLGTLPPATSTASAARERRISAFPGQLQSARWFARNDGAFRVAFELEAAAGSQVTAERQEPAANPAGVGAGIPDIGDRSGKLAAQFDDMRRGVVQVPVGNGAPAVVEFGDEITHVGSSWIVDQGRRGGFVPARSPARRGVGSIAGASR